MKHFAAIIVILTAIMGMSMPVYAKQAEKIDRTELEKICAAAGEEFGICPEILEEIVEKESALNIYAENEGCYGLCQISTKWHEERMESLGVKNVYDPEGNIRTAASYLAELFEENCDVYYVLMRYNMKKSTADQLYSEGKFTDYAISICERAAELEREHGK